MKRAKLTLMIFVWAIGAPAAHRNRTAVYALTRTAAMTMNIQWAVGAASTVGQ